MPQLDETRNGRYIGYRSSRRFIWSACLGCGKPRWVALKHGKPERLRCHKCANGLMSKDKHPHWKGGRISRGDGYFEVRVYSDDFFAPMADKRGYVLEHRLVMAKYLGRCLHLWELVHHRNGNRGDNHIENLQLVTDERHKQITLLENKIKLLEKENISLKCRLKNL